MVWHSIELIRGVILSEKLIEQIFRLKIKKNIDKADCIEIMGNIDDDNDSDDNSDDSDVGDNNDVDRNKPGNSSKIKKNINNHEINNDVEINFFRTRPDVRADILNKHLLNGSGKIKFRREVGFQRMGNCCDINKDIILGYSTGEYSLNTASKKSTEIKFTNEKDKKIIGLCKKIGIENPEIKTYVQATDCAECT